MIKNSFTSQAGQQFLRRVFQAISKASYTIEARQKNTGGKNTTCNPDHDIDTTNQKLIIAKTRGAIFINDISTLDEIAMANNKRSKNKLFSDHDFTRNVHDLKILFELLDDPIKRHSFLYDPDSKIEIPAIKLASHLAEVIPITR